MDAADGVGDGDWGARSVTGATLERVDALRNHERDYDALAERLARRGQRAETVVQAVGRFAVAVPSWALGTGGTRFGRFPGPGEPRTLAEKLADAAVVHRLTGAAPRVSLHIPWDEPDDVPALRALAAELGPDSTPSTRTRSRTSRASR